jgi:Zinc-finger double-stranded RNA-binding
MNDRKIKVRDSSKRNMKENSKTSIDRTSTNNSEGILTAAEMIRQAQQRKPQLAPESTSISNTTTNISTIKSSINDIDDEIQRLERELQRDNDVDVDIEDDDDTSTGSNRSYEQYDDDNKKDAMILSISKSNQNLIEKLPTHCLPPPLVTNKSHSTKSKGNANKKRSRTDDTNAINSNISGTGLKKAVQELMQNYQGRTSTERVPYYCRYCQHQATNYNEFVQHQTIPSHLHNVTIHNKASYCKLCSKQFNSPIQLQEHLQSKPHHDRLQYLQSKQQKQSPHLNNNRTSHRHIRQKYTSP